MLTRILPSLAALSFGLFWSAAGAAQISGPQRVFPTRGLGGFRSGAERLEGGGRGVSLLSRFDRNGNGMLDPDEQQGTAQFILRIEWTSAEDHMQKFRKSEEFRAFFAHIRPYLKDISEMRHYERVIG